MNARKLATLPTLARLFEAGIRGSDWYARANESIATYADKRGLSLGYVADIVALTSPRKQVAENVRIARRYFETGQLVGVLPSVRVQFERWLETGVIHGPKCRAFARALKGDKSALVVDVWIMRALRAPIRSTGTKWVLEAAQRKFSKLAEITGYSIVETQAAVWCGIQGGKVSYLEL